MAACRKGLHTNQPGTKKCLYCKREAERKYYNNVVKHDPEMWERLCQRQYKYRQRRRARDPNWRVIKNLEQKIYGRRNALKRLEIRRRQKERELVQLARELVRLKKKKG